MHNFSGRDILSMKGMERTDLEMVFEVAREMEKILRARTRTDLLHDKMLGLMFFQVSTRTRISFESAMQRLGGGVVGFVDPKTTRAGDYYGESLHDTVRMMENYADVLVVRHPQELAPAEAAATVDIPVINAGDGYNEHPTQAMLDLYTILRERGSLSNLTIALSGGMDLRAMHSLSVGLAQFQPKVYLVAPPENRMPESWRQELVRSGLDFTEIDEMNEDVLKEIEVFYPVAATSPSYHVGHTDTKTEKPPTPEPYVIDRQKVSRATRGVIVLHSLPRTGELPTDVDNMAAARYWVQSHYGVAVRMALLALVLGRMP